MISLRCKPFLAALCVVSSTVPLAAQDVPITYQGRLDEAGGPAHGVYDFQFSVYDAVSGGTALFGPTPVEDLTLSNGLFTAQFPVATWMFDGRPLWLQVETRTNGPGPFTILEPRTRLTFVPYAIHALQAGGTTSGAITTAMLADGVVTGAKLDADAVDTLRIADGTVLPDDLALQAFGTTFWKTDGNAGTTAGTHFLGTTDNQPLELKVNGQRGLRVQPGSLTTPNWIGGSWVNEIGPGVDGATIAGGGTDTLPFGGASYTRSTNRIEASYASIGGGFGNEIHADALAAFIGSGAQNTVASNAWSASIGGGAENFVGEDGLWVTISGGAGNEVAADGRALTSSFGGTRL